MAYTPKVLGQVALGTAEGDVYTVPALNVARVNLLVLNNTSSTDRTVRIWVIPSGGASSIANALYYDFTVPANTPVVERLDGMFLAAGDKIRGLASAAAVVSCQVFGMEKS